MVFVSHKKSKKRVLQDQKRTQNEYWAPCLVNILTYISSYPHQLWKATPKEKQRKEKTKIRANISHSYPSRYWCKNCRTDEGFQMIHHHQIWYYYDGAKMRSEYIPTFQCTKRVKLNFLISLQQFKKENF